GVGVVRGGWGGVAFRRGGARRVAGRRQLITLGFHEPPLRLFPACMPASDGRRNESTIDFADPGSITVGFLAKEPGAEIRLGAAEMIFRYRHSFFTGCGPQGYCRLRLHAMLGDQYLFTRADAIERLWEISAPLLDNPPPARPYVPGSWGPQPALDHLVAPYRWHLPDGGSRRPAHQATADRAVSS